MDVKQMTIVGAVVAIAAIVAASIFVGGAEQVQAENAITGNAVVSGDVQEVTLTFKNYEYQLEPSTLQKNVPVRMTVDLETVYGCMRDVVISSFGVRKYVKAGDNIIEFTPDKTGTFNIACSMNMGRGKFTVVDQTGSTSGFVEKEPVAVAGSSCGGSGSCGCGGA